MTTPSNPNAAKAADQKQDALSWAVSPAGREFHARGPLPHAAGDFSRPIRPEFSIDAANARTAARNAAGAPKGEVAAHTPSTIRFPLQLVTGPTVHFAEAEVLEAGTPDQARRIIFKGSLEEATFVLRACNAHAGLVEALEATTEALRRAMQHVPANAVNMDIALHSPIADARTLDHCERVLSDARAALTAAKL